MNVYEKSLDDKGEGKLDYLNAGDFIHPSQTGILFISQQIADFISKEKIIPNPWAYQLTQAEDLSD